MATLKHYIAWASLCLAPFTAGAGEESLKLNIDVDNASGVAASANTNASFGSKVTSDVDNASGITASTKTSASSGGKATSDIKTSPDINYGSALYDYYQGDYLGALSQLHVAAAQGGIQGHGDNPRLSEAGIGLAYGMEEHARRVFDELLDGSRPVGVRNAAWFYLARLQYSRGNWAGAQLSLQSVESLEKDDLSVEVEALRINIAIRLDQLESAAEALEELPESSPWKNYLQFNLGAAYSRQGNHPASIVYYDAVRDLPVPDSLPDREEYLALYDKALTAAGYSLMMDDQPVEAIKRFVQVRKASPWSARALLGYGWSALESKNYRLALQPWQLLVQGPIELASTQEALLALPYVYEQLDARGEALAEWQQAEARFSEQLVQLDETLVNLETLSLVSEFELAAMSTDSHWLASAEAYPIPKSLSTLQEELSSHIVRANMQRLRDLRHMQGSLDDWQKKIVLYKSMVDERFARRAAKSDVLLALDLETRRKDLLARSQAYREKLEAIENKNDYLALAVGESSELYDIVQRLGLKLNELKAMGEDLGFEEEAYRRYRGILLWQASETYSDQLWIAKKHLRDLDSALSSFDSHRESIDRVLTDAPDILPWHQRLDSGNTRIVEHQAKLKRLIAKEEEALRRHLLSALALQRQHLKNYLSQTRLAIARLLDAAMREQQP